jgi:antitoxin ParD1/3/4
LLALDHHEIEPTKMNVSLTPALEKLVQKKIATGLYNNASEVIREALRLMKDAEEIRAIKLKRLKAALAEGEADVASGRVTLIESDDDLAEFFSNL